MTDELVFRNAAIELRTNAPQIAKLADQAPDKAYAHVRDLFGAIFGSHRREWIARKGVEFRRGGMVATGVSANPRVSGWTGRAFFYRVVPNEKRRPEGASIDDIAGEVYTTSVAAELQETGGTTKPKVSRWLALPIGVTLRADGQPVPVWRTPAKYRRAKAGNELVSADLGHGPTLYQVRRVSKSASAKVGATQRLSDRGRKRSERRVLIPAYKLVRTVTHKPVLQFYATWDALQGDRSARIARMMDELVREVARGR